MLNCGLIKYKLGFLGAAQSRGDASRAFNNVGLVYLSLLGYSLNEEVCPDVVHIGDEDGAIFWSGVRWVNILLNSGAPMDPLTCCGETHLQYYGIIWERK